MRRRTRARECALKVLYSNDICNSTAEEALKDYFNNQEVENDEVKVFTAFIVNGVIKNRDSIDATIIKYAENWELKRMAVIDRNILRMATFELLFAPEIPAKVTINEAVELAKKYGDENSGKFVNGVIDAINKKEAKDKKV